MILAENPHDGSTSVPSLASFSTYLEGAGWLEVDQDSRTSLWRPASEVADAQDVAIVLPIAQEVVDYSERIAEALRALAYVERRLTHEIVGDMNFGGADTLAVRLTPDAPPGEAPLEVAYAAVEALRNLIVASATALDIHSLVLPLRRPQRAEIYAKKVRLSTQSGSFVLSLALPLHDTFGDQVQVVPASESLIPDKDMPKPLPFGRRVTNRLAAAAESACSIADDVSSGKRRIEAFGHGYYDAPNATELAALAALGGPELDLYQMRIARSPLANGSRPPTLMSITPGQQRIFAEAADFLRTRQPRAGVIVVGLVVRLFRESGARGPGQVVIQGVDDDTGASRRYRVELSEEDYNEAVRAHRLGLQVAAEGDLQVRGTRLSLNRLSSFNVIPGLDDD